MNPATWRTVFLAVVGLLVLWLAYLARAVVTPLLVALVLAYMLDPVVRFLERRGLSRGLASGLVVVVALATLVGSVGFATKQFVQEAASFYDNVLGEPAVDAARAGDLAERLSEKDSEQPDWRERIGTAEWEGRRVVYFDRDRDLAYDPGHAVRGLVKLRAAIEGGRFQGPLKRAIDELDNLWPALAKSADAFLGGLVAGGRAVVASFLGWLTIAVLFPIYLYYALVNLSRVYDTTVRHLPQGQRPRVVEILHKIHVTMSAFFRGRLITMLVKGTLLLVLFAAFGVPFSYVCAAFAALASLVPVVGGLAAAIPPIALALPSSTGTELLGLAAGIAAIEVFEGYVLIPALVGKSVGLHPLTVLVCTLVAGDLLGFFGMIVAVPLTAVLKILAVEFVLPELRRRAGLDPPLPAAEPVAASPPEPPPAPPPAADTPT